MENGDAATGGGGGGGERESLRGSGGRLSAPSLDSGAFPPSSPEEFKERNGHSGGLSWAEFGRQYARGRFDPVSVPPAPNDVDSSLALPRTARALRNPSIDRPQLNSEPNTRAEQYSLGSQGPWSAPCDGPQSVNGRKMSSDGIPKHSHATQALKVELSPGHQISAATARLASAHMTNGTFSPLNVPSPDMELIDPLSSFSGFAQSGLSPDRGTNLTAPMKRTTSAYGYDPLPTIQASPAETPGEINHTTKRRPPPPTLVRNAGGMLRSIPPASAPLQHSQQTVTPQADDYFGSQDIKPSAEAFTSSNEAPDTEDTTPEVTEWPSIRSSTQCEPFFDKYGFLAAPLSPWEGQRLKALYSYNILHTAADINFDRIAHMIKLVFKAKMTFISLLDSESCWFKARSGFQYNHLPRTTSMCSHTILLESDEPLVILDTKQDWRFANNPHVVGDPKVRFYAGAPLRTSKGHNLGSLCIVDDQPHTEFPPRSRHILKEFAAIVMRELELWRDRVSGWADLLTGSFNCGRATRFRRRWKSLRASVSRSTTLRLASTPRVG